MCMRNHTSEKKLKKSETQINPKKLIELMHKYWNYSLFNPTVFVTIFWKAWHCPSKLLFPSKLKYVLYEVIESFFANHKHWWSLFFGTIKWKLMDMLKSLNLLHMKNLNIEIVSKMKLFKSLTTGLNTNWPFKNKVDLHCKCFFLRAR